MQIEDAFLAGLITGSLQNPKARETLPLILDSIMLASTDPDPQLNYLANTLKIYNKYHLGS